MTASANRASGLIATAVLALLAIAVGAWQLHAATRGVATESTAVDGTPVTIFRSVDGPPTPVVVIAHGFAGSQQLM